MEATSTVISNVITKKEENPKRKRNSSALEDTASRRRSSRDTKPVEMFVPAVANRQIFVTPSKFQVGKGCELGSIEGFENSLTRLKAKDKTVITLHRLLYGNPGDKYSRKSSIRFWNGFAEDTVEKDKLSLASKLDRLKYSDLRNVTKLFGITGTSKQALCFEFIDFLSCPVKGAAKRTSNVKTPAEKSKPLRSPKTTRASVTAQKGKGGSAVRSITALGVFCGTKLKEGGDHDWSAVYTEWKELDDEKRKLFEGYAKSLVELYEKSNETDEHSLGHRNKKRKVGETKTEDAKLSTDIKNDEQFGTDDNSQASPTDEEDNELKGINNKDEEGIETNIENGEDTETSVNENDDKLEETDVDGNKFDEEKKAEGETISEPIEENSIDKKPLQISLDVPKDGDLLTIPCL